MELDNIIYPGFNKSLSELNAISKIKKKSCEIVDLTEIEWVRDVLRHRVEEVGTYDIKFRKPTDEEIKSVSEIVGADINIDELKNNFHKYIKKLHQHLSPKQHLKYLSIYLR